MDGRLPGRRVNQRNEQLGSRKQPVECLLCWAECRANFGGNIWKSRVASLAICYRKYDKREQYHLWMYSRLDGGKWCDKDIQGCCYGKTLLQRWQLYDLSLYQNDNSNGSVHGRYKRADWSAVKYCAA